jgi:uncharacterized OB-fold protein
MAEIEFTSAAFYQALRDKKLMGTRCKECGEVYLPPRQICIRCQGTDMEWQSFKGDGKLVAFTTIAVGTARMAAEGHSRHSHYCCGIVELCEGPRVCALILGVDSQRPTEIEIGTPLRVEFRDSGERPPMLSFRPL